MMPYRNDFKKYELLSFSAAIRIRLPKNFIAMKNNLLYMNTVVIK